MLRPLATSVIVHILVVVLFTFSWSFFEDNRPVAQPLVVVDVVATVPKTNVAQGQKSEAAKPKPAAARREVPKPPPPPPPARPKPPAPKPAPKPVQKPAPKPEVADTAEILPEKPSAVDVPLPKPELKTPEKVDIALPVRRPKAPKTPAVPAPKPKQKPKPKPAATPTPKPKPAPKTEAKPAPKPKPKADPDAAARLADRVNKLAKQQKKKDRDEALTGVLQNLAKASASADEADQKKNQPDSRKSAEDKLAKAVGQAVQAPEPVKAAPMGLSELDRLRAHITQYWSPPVGAANAHKLAVVVRITRLERDGSVSGVEVDDKARYKRDRVFRTAADAAVRAVIEASPLPLPVEKFDQWKDGIIFTFDPSFISGE